MFESYNFRNSYELMVGSNDRLCRASDCSRRLLSSAVRVRNSVCLHDIELWKFLFRIIKSARVAQLSNYSTIIIKLVHGALIVLYNYSLQSDCSTILKLHPQSHFATLSLLPSNSQQSKTYSKRLTPTKITIIGIRLQTWAWIVVSSSKNIIELVMARITWLLSVRSEDRMHHHIVKVHL